MPVSTSSSVSRQNLADRPDWGDTISVNVVNQLKTNG